MGPLQRACLDLFCCDSELSVTLKKATESIGRDYSNRFSLKDVNSLFSHRKFVLLFLVVIFVLVLVSNNSRDKNAYSTAQIITEEIEPDVQFKPEISLSQETTHIKGERSAGLLERVYQLTLVDGQEERRELLGADVLPEAKRRLILQRTELRSLGETRDSLWPGDSWQGRASWYGGAGDGFHGRKTASGDIFDSNALTAAHPFLPFGTIVFVTHLNSGKEVVVRINDRGPFIEGRIIDLSKAAAKAIGMHYEGVAEVKVQIKAQ